MTCSDTKFACAGSVCITKEKTMNNRFENKYVKTSYTIIFFTVLIAGAVLFVGFSRIKAKLAEATTETAKPTPVYSLKLSEKELHKTIDALATVKSGATILVKSESAAAS